MLDMRTCYGHKTILAINYNNNLHEISSQNIFIEKIQN